MIEVLCMRMVKMFKQNLFDASKYIKAKPVVKWAGGKTYSKRKREYIRYDKSISNLSWQYLPLTDV